MTAGPESKHAQTMSDFADEIKDVLSHLYDFPYLQSHALAGVGGASGSRSARRDGQWLRQEVISAIETLAPESAVSFRSPQSRPYQLLQLHHVEGMTVQEAARELGVSERQAYRDLKRGEDSVATLLWSRWADEPALHTGQAARLSSLESEVAAVEIRRSATDINDMVQQAIKAVERLASGRGVKIAVHRLAEETVISTDSSLGVQILTKILSHSIQSTTGTAIEVTISHQDDAESIQVQYRDEARSGQSLDDDQVVVKLIDKLRWSFRRQIGSDHERIAILRIPLHGPTILIVDDNRGLVELLDRYLTGHACKVVAANNGSEGLRLAALLRPQAIILDVMMPDIDGWEVLQRVKANPDTARIPVIICSVFDDPELAYSLGASRFVPKPTRRVVVLEALRELGIISHV